MFYEVKYKPHQVERVKVYMAKKNRFYGNDNYGKDKGSRWIGLFGEDAFRKWLDAYGYKGKYKYDTKFMERNKEDFIIGNVHAEVKTRPSNHLPAPYCKCRVVEAKANRYLQPDNPVNFFIFAHYFLPEDKVLLLGWVTKADFFAGAEYIPKDTQLKNFKATTAMYQIGDYMLKDMAELDRYINV